MMGFFYMGLGIGIVLLGVAAVGWSISCIVGSLPKEIGINYLEKQRAIRNNR